ncbi:phage head closure protein [Roseateles asaccharophilus]|uniref:SPP1 family predicted phage head-tail adaptor n=1 Tax=Roseateles asaccharophilus TaxID=582607 RepID=A0ABU2A3J7_9BURK|nr:phage head closure protein [Roseateles asaccharophilus]MDR7331761.1 SPP1 family predicted phage head-tail adaptor [Roseateles asaccharophilus]
MLTTYRERMLGAGDLDRRVTLLARTLTRDPVYGAQEESWADAATLWAKVEESSTAGEAQARDGQATYGRPHRVTLRWRAGVTTDMRLRLDDGRLLQILGASPLGRRKWLELSCVEWRHQQS